MTTPARPLIFLPLLVFIFSLSGMLPINAADSPAPAAEAGTAIQWVAYDDAVDAASKQDKKVYLYFYADWCHYCKVMNSKTFVSEQVITRLNDDFIPVRIKMKDQARVAEQFNVQGVPSSWFLENTGERIGAKPGYLPPEQFLDLLNFVTEEKYK